MIGKIKWVLWGKSAAQEYAELKARTERFPMHGQQVRVPPPPSKPGPPPPPPPAWSPRHHYGGSGTIHRTGTIDVQIAPNGDVEAVWFRCLNLPFTVSRRTESSPYINPSDRVAIEEITYVDLPREVE